VCRGAAVAPALANSINEGVRVPGVGVGWERGVDVFVCNTFAPASPADCQRGVDVFVCNAFAPASPGRAGRRDVFMPRMHHAA
jgi:hypothetical protein